MRKNFLAAILLALFFAGCTRQPSETNLEKWETSTDEEVVKSKEEISKNAISLLMPQCEDYDMNACNDAGANFEFLKDYANAFKLYKKACDGGVELGCANLGLLYESGLGVQKDPRKAIELYKNGCNKGGAHSCYNLGNAYRKGEIVAQDYQLAMSAYVNACEAGDVPSCANIGAMYELGLGVEKDEMKAYHIYKVACFRGLNKACPQMKRLGQKLGQN